MTRLVQLVALFLGVRDSILESSWALVGARSPRLNHCKHEGLHGSVWGHPSGAPDKANHASLGVRGAILESSWAPVGSEPPAFEPLFLG